MTMSRKNLLALLLLVAGVVGGIAFAASFPAVEGLGTKVRLPVFHGAMTWVNLGAFSLMGLLAIATLLTRSERAYRWEEALRWVAVAMWMVGTGLGLLAAMNTWDFTGSKASRLSVVTADPRLMAQFWILIAGLALVAFGMLIEDRRWLSSLDIGFTLVMWGVLLSAVLGPGRALHPDSPVLNSEELLIKLLFFGIVISIAVATLAAAWLISNARGRSGEGLAAASS